MKNNNYNNDMNKYNELLEKLFTRTITDVEKMQFSELQQKFGFGEGIFINKPGSLGFKNSNKRKTTKNNY